MCHALRSELYRPQRVRTHCSATGSSTCDIAMVATGEVDLYWDAGCYPWDVAVGHL